MDEVIEALAAERGFVALRDENGDLDFRTAHGIDQTTIDHPEFSGFFGGHRSSCSKGTICADQRCSARSALQRSVACHRLGLRSIICIPL
jgi:hypothetical protein